VKLDPILRDVASHGVFVSSHPDVILKTGTKEVLYRTRNMSWGTDTRRYMTVEQFRRELPQCLAEGKPRVLKQNRGNDGIGVWKVEAVYPCAPVARVRVREFAEPCRHTCESSVNWLGRHRLTHDLMRPLEATEAELKWDVPDGHTHFLKLS
jgi:hypothetical protein